jgi:hypothetical protein
LISGRRRSGRHRRHLRRRRRPALSRERGERKGSMSCVSVRRAREDIHEVGLEFLNPGRTRGFGGKLDRVQYRPGLTEQVIS